LTLLETFYLAYGGIFDIISSIHSMHSFQHICGWILHIPHGKFTINLFQHIHKACYTISKRFTARKVAQTTCSRFFDFLELSPFLGIFDFRKTPWTRISTSTVFCAEQMHLRTQPQQHCQGCRKHRLSPCCHRVKSNLTASQWKKSTGYEKEDFRTERVNDKGDVSCKDLNIFVVDQSEQRRVHRDYEYDDGSSKRVSGSSWISITIAILIQTRSSEIELQVLLNLWDRALHHIWRQSSFVEYMLMGVQ